MYVEINDLKGDILEYRVWQINQHLGHLISFTWLSLLCSTVSRAEFLLMRDTLKNSKNSSNGHGRQTGLESNADPFQKTLLLGRVAVVVVVVVAEGPCRYAAMS
jgi:hypothetical protein